MGGPIKVDGNRFAPFYDGGSEVGAAYLLTTLISVGRKVGRVRRLIFAKSPSERAPRDRCEALRGTFRRFPPKSAGAGPYFGSSSAERQKCGPHRSESI